MPASCTPHGYSCVILVHVYWLCINPITMTIYDINISCLFQLLSQLPLKPMATQLASSMSEELRAACNQALQILNTIDQCDSSVYTSFPCPHGSDGISGRRLAARMCQGESLPLRSWRVRYPYGLKRQIY